MTPTILIGDIHADFAVAKRLIQREEARAGRRLPSVQVGDYGFGNWSPAEKREVEAFYQQNRRHRFLRGNHDRLSDAENCAGFLQDGSIFGGVLFLGGADGALPGMGATEIPSDEMARILYELKHVQPKPSVIITHDAPQFVAQRIANDVARTSTGSSVGNPDHVTGQLGISRTRTFLAEVFSIIQPRLWMFGHWHHAWAHDEGATHFRALGYQEAFTVPLPWPGAG